MSDEMNDGPMIQTPSDFGHFLLEKELGHGGMGGVYLARDKMLDRKVAIKVMLKELGSDPTFVERFQREAQAAARLNHPNIAQIYSFGQEQGMPYIAMELVPGGSLDKEMEQNPGALDPVHVMRIGQQLVDALALAAEQGLVHGDVKPENVLFTEDGSAKLVDFGLAAMQGDSNEIWGTPYYISPEKCRRQKIDFRADIYSLGGTLYHALTGQPPFEGADANAVVMARFNGPPRKPSEVRPGLPPELDAILMRMLELEPAMRYPTYQSLMGDIKRYLAKAGPATPSSKLGGPRVRIKGKKPKMNLGGGEIESSVAAPDGIADLMPEEGAGEEKRLNLGLVVGGVVGGIVLLILLVVGGLFWYVHAEKEREARQRQTEIVDKQTQARNAIATTVKSITEFGANFHELVVKGDKEIAAAVRELRGVIPEELRPIAAGFIEPPPAADIADAIAYTNALLSPQPVAAPAEEAPKAEAATNAPPAAAKDGKPAATNAPPDAVKNAKEAPDAKEKPAEEAKPAEDEKPDDDKKPEVEVPMAVKQFMELWNDVYFCRGADIRVQGHVIKLLREAEAVKDMTAEDLETVEKMAKLSQNLVEGFDALRGQKFVEQTQRKANVIRTRSVSLVKTATQQIARAKAKAEKAAREAAEKAAREEAAAKAAEEHKAKVEEETALAGETFEKLVGMRLKTLDWEPALKELKRVMGDMETLEGKDAMRTQQKKVECMRALQQLFVAKTKGFKFKSGRVVTAVVTAVDDKSITIQNQRQVRGKTVAEREQKIDWTRFYGKKEHVGLMNQLINQLVLNGRETVHTPPLRWSEQMFGAALTLQLLYTEVEGAAEFAPTLVKKAAAEFEPARKLAKKMFPDVEVGEVDE